MWLFVVRFYSVSEQKLNCQNFFYSSGCMV
nr:MAG TPA: hypothetical protein [Caudoviricetes sp.]